MILAVGASDISIDDKTSASGSQCGTSSRLRRFCAVSGLRRTMWPSCTAQPEEQDGGDQTATPVPARAWLQAAAAAVVIVVVVVVVIVVGSGAGSSARCRDRTGRAGRAIRSGATRAVLRARATGCR